MENFVLIRVITVIYHTISFIWAIILTHANWYHFLNNLLVMKNSHCQWFMPNLCYIIYFDLCIRAFWLADNFFFFLHDPCPSSIYIIFDQNDGRVVDSPLSCFFFVLLAFSRIFPMGGWGGPEKD